MADGPESLPVVDPEPEPREGRTVSILTDRRMIVRAFERGWIESAELADELLDEAIEDVDAYRAALHDPLELLKASAAVAKIAQGAVNMRTKAVKAAEGQAVAPGTVNNTQVNIDARGNEALVAELKRQLSVDELLMLRGKMGSNGKGHH